MIDNDKVKTIGSSNPGDSKAPFNWASLPLGLLLKYRSEIDQFLPPTELSKMNMEEEMILQFHTIRVLQTEVLDDDTIPPNQRVQVANSVASSLTKLTELQKELYTTERFKAIENLLIRTLNKLPEELAAEFLDAYEKIIKQHKGW